MDCGQYRPISVLNLDYKIYTSIIGRRLDNIMPNLIKSDQTGFVRQRQTQDSIRRTLHVIQHIQNNNIEAMLIGLDTEKAFDSVRWSFIYQVLTKFGFH